jgi:hypothetical protein
MSNRRPTVELFQYPMVEPITFTNPLNVTNLKYLPFRYSNNDFRMATEILTFFPKKVTPDIDLFMNLFILENTYSMTNVITHINRNNRTLNTNSQKIPIISWLNAFIDKFIRDGMIIRSRRGVDITNDVLREMINYLVENINTLWLRVRNLMYIQRFDHLFAYNFKLSLGILDALLIYTLHIFKGNEFLMNTPKNDRHKIFMEGIIDIIHLNAPNRLIKKSGNMSVQNLLDTILSAPTSMQSPPTDTPIIVPMPNLGPPPFNSQGNPRPPGPNQRRGGKKMKKRKN